MSEVRAGIQAVWSWLVREDGRKEGREGVKTGTEGDKPALKGGDLRVPKPVDARDEEGDDRVTWGMKEGGRGREREGEGREGGTDHRKGGRGGLEAIRVPATQCAPRGPLPPSLPPLQGSPQMRACA
jgi:hypothetical protein